MEAVANREKHLVLPLINLVLFPKSEIKFGIDEGTGRKVLEMIKYNSKTLIGLTLKRDANRDSLDQNSFFQTGTRLKLLSIQPADKGYLLNVEAIEKVKARDFDCSEEGVYVNYDVIPNQDDLDEKSQLEMVDFLKTSIWEIGENFRGSEYFLKPLNSMNSVDQIIGFTLPYMPITLAEKQRLLELDSLRERSLKFIDILMKQKEGVSFQIEMAKKFSEKSDKNYRESYLKQQLKAIQDELNESEGNSDKPDDYKQKIEASDMPKDIRKIAFDELKKLNNAGSNNSESHVIRNYLDLLIALPWKTDKKNFVDLEHAREILSSQHHGLEKVKDRIIQHLAVLKLKEDKQGSILLFVGPPGTGKTSLGKSIAEALGRKYVRISLGGVRDEAEVRGHRRTYIGALPGRIIQGIKKAGEKNPVFVLDEIDKLSTSYAGDPARALLEVLDPEQNDSFSDHYLEVPYDLSDVLFIATANSLNSIPAPLLDRTEVIQISSYTNQEKLLIGKDHLIPSVLEEHGMDESKLQFEEKALRSIIEKYTQEAGVRGLKKKLSEIARYASEKIVVGKTELPILVKDDMLPDILGKSIFRHEAVQKENVPGVVTGLAWTPVGGEILFVEGSFMVGSGKLTLTGQLGDVMKESASISLSLIRSRLASYISHFEFIKNDVHIHVPSGATPKDGPSAGVALFTALASLTLGKQVDSKLAMTGEITLRGSIMPVGGIKEKVIAAHRAGIKKVLLPKENEIDLSDIPIEIIDELHFVFVETIEDVLKETLDIDLPKPEVHIHPFRVQQIESSLVF